MDGNINLVTGQEFDTGKKYVDANGDSHVIYRKAVANADALPNNNNDDVPHGIASIDLDKPIVLSRFTAWNGTTTRLLQGVVTITVTATNINIATTANLSAYTTSVIEIEYCK